ncbi:MAG: MetQ/NlpA family ABC transporter substrate-binding protein [Raoultibacter sp.]|jgi:D-methionine transport system substrate-binding protein
MQEIRKSKARIVLVASLCLVMLLSLVACGSSNSNSSSGASEVQIAVPSDTTNEARALLLLEEQGLIKLTEGVGLKATANDIIDNPYNIKIVETEAASLPRTLQDVDMAVINGNYALSGGIDPESALAGEDASSDAAIEYANVIAVRADDMGSEKTKVLVEVLQSDEVKKFITDSYNGAVVPVDVAALPVSDGTSSDDKVIKVGASPAPHAEILAFAKDLIKERGYTLEIVEFSDYVQPNVALNDGELDANYFQHYPYLEEYNNENGTTLASAAKIHFEPLCLYPGKIASIDDLKK